MIIDGYRIKKNFISLYTIMLFLILVNFVDDYVIDGKLTDSINNKGLILLYLALFVVIFLRGKTFFFFDGVGEVLIFQNSYYPKKNNISSRIEIPKSKLKSYSIEGNFLRRKLKVFIDSDESVKKITFDISYLKSAEVKLLEEHLFEVEELNKKD